MMYMKPFNPLFRAALAAAMLWQGATIHAATVVTVNSTNNQNIADAEIGRASCRERVCVPV